MENKNHLSVYLSKNTKNYKTKPVYQYDHGLKLCLMNFEKENIQVHFGNSKSTEAINVTFAKSSDGVMGSIPDTLLARPESIVAYVYYEDEVYGKTEYQILIPIIPRPRPTKVTIESMNFAPYNELVAQLQELRSDVDDIQANGGSSGSVSVTDDGNGNVTISF